MRNEKPGMTNTGHLEILKQRIEAWNRWREENLVIKPNPSNSEFYRPCPLLADIAQYQVHQFQCCLVMGMPLSSLDPFSALDYTG